MYDSPSDDEISGTSQLTIESSENLMFQGEDATFDIFCSEKTTADSTDLPTSSAVQEEHATCPEFSTIYSQDLPTCSAVQEEHATCPEFSTIDSQDWMKDLEISESDEEETVSGLQGDNIIFERTLFEPDWMQDVEISESDEEETVSGLKGDNNIFERTLFEPLPSTSYEHIATTKKLTDCYDVPKKTGNERWCLSSFLINKTPNTSVEQSTVIAEDNNTIQCLPTSSAVQREHATCPEFSTVDSQDWLHDLDISDSDEEETASGIQVDNNSFQRTLFDTYSAEGLEQNKRKRHFMDEIQTDVKRKMPEILARTMLQNDNTMAVSGLEVDDERSLFDRSNESIDSESDSTPSCEECECESNDDLHSSDYERSFTHEN